MRSRNLKPGFFKNEHLIACSFPARILFEGLWCLADKEGRLEDRPLKIKFDVFPGDNLDVGTLLVELEAQGLIIRYTVGTQRLIGIPTFRKHQNPHKKELESTLPAPAVTKPSKTKPGKNVASRGKPGLVVDEPEPARLNPPCLNPESGIPPPESPLLESSIPATPVSSNEDAGALFDYWRLVMQHPGAQFTPERERKVRARLRQGYTPDQIKAAIDGCKASPYNQGENLEGRIYDDLELICRNGSKLEGFMNRVGATSRSNGKDKLDLIKLNYEETIQRLGGAKA